MKKLILILCISLSLSSISQNEFSQFVFTPSSSISLLRNIHKKPYISYETNFYNTVGQQLHFDAALLRRLSFGFGYTHQKHVLSINNYQFYSNQVLIKEKPTVSFNVNSIYVRALIHVNSVYDASIDMFDVYWGTQVGILVINSSNTSQDPNFHNPSTIVPPFISVVGGVRFYPFSQLGLSFETSFPGPYTFSAGFSYRFPY